jgi:hypothetical protein
MYEKVRKKIVPYFFREPIKPNTLVNELKIDSNYHNFNQN